MGTPSQALAKSIKLYGEGKYRRMRTSEIEIVSRPQDGETKLFFNARSAQQFTPEKLASLIYSIRLDELRTAPEVGIETEGGQTNGRIIRALLIAGERRTRSVRHIYDNDLPVYDSATVKPKAFQKNSIVVAKGMFGVVLDHDKKEGTVVIKVTEARDQPEMVGQETTVEYKNVHPTVSGKEKYEFIEVRPTFNPSDEDKVRLSHTENGEREPLTISEEIDLVEHLSKHMKQEAIVSLIHQNITWVSQTASFRKELPPAAFQKLLEGNMPRHVAVQILSYKKEDRQELFEQLVKTETKRRKQKISQLKMREEEKSDDELIHRQAAKDAEARGDIATATKENRIADIAASKARIEKQRREREEAQSGKLTSGHIKIVKEETGLRPRKAKAMERDEIENFQKRLEPIIKGNVLDPVVGKKCPKDVAEVMLWTAKAILEGETDPLTIMRKLMVARGEWTLPKKGKKGKGRPKQEEEDYERDPEREAQFARKDDDDDEESSEFERGATILEDEEREEDFDGSDDDFRGFDVDRHNEEWN